MSSRVASVFLGSVGVAALLIACGDSAPPEKPKSSTPAATANAAAGGGADGGLAPGNLPKMEFSENDFAESDRNRDPFRTYLSIISPKEAHDATRSQRVVILPDYSLDELHLVAIVMGGDYPRAMVVDPGGKGWVIKRGDWVGRQETVHVGGANGADYSLNWRVDKVRDGDIVFTREDPAQPGIPPASRVIQLRPDADNTREKL